MHEVPTEQPTTERELARAAALERQLEATARIGIGPHIWVGTVTDYLRAEPYGHWIDASQPLAQVRLEVSDMVRASPSGRADRPAEVPWHVFAHSGFGRHEPSAGAPLATLHTRAQQYHEDLRAYRAWASLGGDQNDWLNQFARCYVGRYERLEDYVVLEVERAGYDRLLDSVVPDTIRPHVEINISSLTHELRESGAVIDVSAGRASGVYVFRLAPDGQQDALSNLQTTS